MPSIYILRLSEDRQKVFDERDGEKNSFSEPVKDFPNHGSCLVLIVSPLGQLTHIASGVQGRFKAGTGLKRLNLSRIQELQSPVSISDLTPHMNRRFWPHIARYFTKSGEPPKASGPALINALISFDPELDNLFRSYRIDRYKYIEKMPSRLRQNLAEQKEALSTALSIAGIKRDELKEWDLSGNRQPRSFLDGLQSTYLREDSMIIRDLQSVPGFEKLNEPISGAAHFAGPESDLTVVLANRLPLEELTGTDLIYYNETFRSFVMVQYKAMEHENGRPVFRLPNKQLSEELERMDKLLEMLKPHTGSGGPESFRLSENPFLLKICPRIDLCPGESDMTTGMYVPLDYWRLIEKDPKIFGPRGGRRITYENIKRYLTNTEFINLVHKAWIGTNDSQSDILEPLIRGIVESGRAVLIAVKKDVVRPTNDSIFIEEV